MSGATILMRGADVIETDPRVLIAGVGLGNFASLLLELALPRLVLYYHFF